MFFRSFIFAVRMNGTDQGFKISSRMIREKW